MKQTAYVLCWRYSDGSARGVHRVYLSKESAYEALALLREGESMRNYDVFEVDLLP